MPDTAHLPAALLLKGLLAPSSASAPLDSSSSFVPVFCGNNIFTADHVYKRSFKRLATGLVVMFVVPIFSAYQDEMNFKAHTVCVGYMVNLRYNWLAFSHGFQQLLCPINPWMLHALKSAVKTQGKMASLLIYGQLFK